VIIWSESTATTAVLIGLQEKGLMLGPMFWVVETFPLDQLIGWTVCAWRMIGVAAVLIWDVLEGMTRNCLTG